MGRSYWPSPNLISRRGVVLLAGCAIAILVALHPPWNASAVRLRMDYTGFPAKPPSMVSDTVMWRVPFAAVYAPPTLDLDAGELAGYQRRLSAGDTSAAGEWQRRTEAVEKRYRVPPKLRSVWIRGAESGSANGFAFRRSIASSQFEIDRARLGIHLVAVAAIVAIGAMLTRKKEAT